MQIIILPLWHKAFSILTAIKAKVVASISSIGEVFSSATARWQCAVFYRSCRRLRVFQMGTQSYSGFSICALSNSWIFCLSDFHSIFVLIRWFVPSNVIILLYLRREKSFENKIKLDNYDKKKERKTKKMDSLSVDSTLYSFQESHSIEILSTKCIDQMTWKGKFQKAWKSEFTWSIEIYFIELQWLSAIWIHSINNST